MAARARALVEAEPGGVAAILADPRKLDGIMSQLDVGHQLVLKTVRAGEAFEAPPARPPARPLAAGGARRSPPARPPPPRPPPRRWSS